MTVDQSGRKDTKHEPARDKHLFSTGQIINIGGLKIEILFIYLFYIL